MPLDIDAANPFLADTLAAQLYGTQADPSRYPTGGNPVLAALAPILAQGAQRNAEAAAARLSAEGASSLPALLAAYGAPSSSGGTVSPWAYGAGQADFPAYAAYRLTQGPPTQATEGEAQLGQAALAFAQAQKMRAQAAGAQATSQLYGAGGAAGTVPAAGGTAAGAGGGAASGLAGVTGRPPAAAKPPPIPEAPALPGTGSSAAPAAPPAESDPLQSIPGTPAQRRALWMKMPWADRMRLLHGLGQPAAPATTVAP